MPPRGRKGGRRQLRAGRKQPWRRTLDPDSDPRPPAAAAQARGVRIGEVNIVRWTFLKDSLGITNDHVFATYLLNLAEKPAAPEPQSILIQQPIVQVTNENQAEVTTVSEPEEKRPQTSTANISKLYEGDFDDEDVESLEDEEDLDWRPTGCRQTRILKRPSRGRKRTESQRQTRSRSRIIETSSTEEESSKTSNSSPSSRTIAECVPEVAIVPKAENEARSNGIEINRQPVRVRACLDCGQKHGSTECPINSPAKIVPDSPWIPDSGKVQADGTLPEVLQLQTIDKVHGPSIFAKTMITKYTLFGPLVGRMVAESEISEDSNLKNVWEVFGETKMYLDTSDPVQSNWLRFVRPAPSRPLRNLTTIFKDNHLYFISIQDILAGAELLYWSEDPTVMWSKKKLEKTSCGGCNQRFEHPLYYRMHCMIFHDPNFSLTIRKYHCKVCGVAVLGKENIMKHAMEMHEGKGAYQCQYCKKFFLRLHSLDTHVSYSCKLNPWKTHPLCESCGKKFCQPQHLRAHIKRMHSDMSEVLKEFQCKTCFKLLGSRAALQRHLKEVHNKDQNIAATCDRCGKTFQNKSNLKIHMLTHSGVKPFRCSEAGCSAAFTTKQCLQFHYKKVHGYGIHNMPVIERCVAYTFESYSGGIPTEFEKREPMRGSRVKQEKENELQKSLQMSAEKLVEAALKTMDSSLSSLAEGSNSCVKHEGSAGSVQILDSTSDNSTMDCTQFTDPPTPVTATSHIHHQQKMDLDSPIASSRASEEMCIQQQQHLQEDDDDDDISPCCDSPKNLQVDETDCSELLTRETEALQRSTGLVTVGMPTATARAMEQKAKDAALHSCLQQLEHSLELSRHGLLPDLALQSQYSKFAIRLARHRPDLMNNIALELDVKGNSTGMGLQNHHDHSASANMDLGPSVSSPVMNHSLGMPPQHHDEQNLSDHHTQHTVKQGHDDCCDNEQDLVLSRHQQHEVPSLDMGRHQEQSLDLGRQQEQNLDLVRHHEQVIDLGRHQHSVSDQHNLDLGRCSSEQGLELSRHTDSGLPPLNCHPDQNLGHNSHSGLSVMGNHPSEHALELVHHGLDMSHAHPTDLSSLVGRHGGNQLDLRRHHASEHALSLASAANEMELATRGLHLDLGQQSAADLGLRGSSRSEHSTLSGGRRGLDIDELSPHHQHSHPHPPQLPSPLRRDHLLEVASRHELGRPLSRPNHSSLLHSELRSPLGSPVTTHTLSTIADQHHIFSALAQHRSQLASPSNHHQDQTLDMSRHATSAMNSPAPSHCSDLPSPLPHQESSMDIGRHSDTPASQSELSRPPSHSIDLSTGRPTTLPLDLNRPPSTRNLAMELSRPPSEQLPLDATAGRMLSTGYQAYSPPMYQTAPPAHMPPQAPTVHSSYHSYPGYY